MICKKCGHENSDIKRCCESCGSILEGWTIKNTTGKYGYRTSAGEFLPSDKAKEKEKLLDDTKLQIEVFVNKKHFELFDEIIKECNIQIIKQNTCVDDIGIFYTLQLVNADEVYWFGRNFQEAISKYHKTV